MTEREYVTPTIDQLANFMEAHAANSPLGQSLGVKPGVMSALIATNQAAYEKAIEIHKQFQRRIWALEDQEKANPLCSHIRSNGKRCVNHKQEGREYCGLHFD